MTSLDLGTSRGRPRARGFTELRGGDVLILESGGNTASGDICWSLGRGGGDTEKGSTQGQRTQRRMPLNASGILCACKGVGRNGLRSVCIGLNGVSRLGKERGRRAVDRWKRWDQPSEAKGWSPLNFRKEGGGEEPPGWLQGHQPGESWSLCRAVTRQKHKTLTKRPGAWCEIWSISPNSLKGHSESKHGRLSMARWGSPGSVLPLAQLQLSSPAACPALSGCICISLPWLLYLPGVCVCEREWCTSPVLPQQKGEQEKEVGFCGELSFPSQCWVQGPHC